MYVYRPMIFRFKKLKKQDSEQEEDEESLIQYSAQKT